MPRLALASAGPPNPLQEGTRTCERTNLQNTVQLAYINTELQCGGTDNRLDALLAREPIHRPVYDFARHDRDDATVPVAPTPVVIMEGILVLHDAALRERFALKVYVDAPRDERFIRRLERDVRERGRSTDSVIAQYRDTVGPMHDLYVEPSKQHADLIVPQGGRNHAAMAVLSSFVERAVHGAPPPVPPSPVPRG
jgi:uridine kinase